MIIDCVNKVKMNNKRVIVFLVLGIFAVSLFAGVVSAQTSTGSSGGSALDRIADLLEKLFKKDINVSVKDPADSSWFPKTLMFLLVALIVYSVAQFLPFMGDNEYVKWGISVIVGIMSIFFLDSEQIATILLSYKAMGIVLTGIVPFVVVAVIAKKLNEGEHRWISKFMWIGLFVVIATLWATAKDIGDFGFWTYLVISIICLGMVFWEKKLWEYLFKKKMEGSVETEQDTQKLTQIARVESQLDDMRRDLDDNVSKYGGPDSSGREHNVIKSIRQRIKAKENELKRLTKDL
jgi:hypothetical protein